MAGQTYVLVDSDGVATNTVMLDADAHLAAWDGCQGACGKPASLHWAPPPGCAVVLEAAVLVNPETQRVTERTTGALMTATGDDPVAVAGLTALESGMAAGAV